MPVQDFALDAQGQYRIQVHWPSESADGPISVLLNRSLIGSLTSEEERNEGKHFPMQDGSLLLVSFVHNQPQVLRNGYALSPIAPVPTELTYARKRGGCLTAWIIFNLVGISIFALTYVFDLMGAVATSEAPLIFTAFSVYLLLCCVGIAGFVLLLAWKKWGFYLVALYVIVAIPLAFSFHIGNVTTFTPLIGLSILYYLLRKNDVWEHLT